MAGKGLSSGHDQALVTPGTDSRLLKGKGLRSMGYNQEEHEKWKASRMSLKGMCGKKRQHMSEDAKKYRKKKKAAFGAFFVILKEAA